VNEAARGPEAAALLDHVSARENDGRAEQRHDRDIVIEFQKCPPAASTC
jgi:hypothetical protein